MEKTTKAIDNGRMQGEWKISRKKTKDAFGKRTSQDKTRHGMVWYGVWRMALHGEAMARQDKAK